MKTNSSIPAILLRQLRFALILGILCTIVLSQRSAAQLFVTAGAKAWYANWNIQIDKSEGVDQSDYSAALLTGPYLSIRYDKFIITGSYQKSVVTFDATAHNPGLFFIGFNANRTLNREDINVFLNYVVAPEVSFFFNYKQLTYSLYDAITYINTNKETSKVKFAGTGLGLGMQITVPFSGGSPLYSFMSTGAISNTLKQTEGVPEGETPSSATELMYFLDAGLGYRFLPTNFGGALGIRVENGKTTKTIIGPTANFFYTFR
jgi:hypothetical protein